MKVEAISIVFLNEAGGRVTCERGKDYLWTISGAVYPRVIKLLYTLNEWAREFDSEGLQAEGR